MFDDSRVKSYDHRMFIGPHALFFLQTALIQQHILVNSLGAIMPTYRKSQIGSLGRWEKWRMGEHPSTHVRAAHSADVRPIRTLRQSDFRSHSRASGEAEGVLTLDASLDATRANRR